MRNNILAIGVLLLFIGISMNTSTGIKVEKNSNIVSYGRDILYVGGSGPNNYTRIQYAIDDASDGDTVFVYNDSSPYNENINIDVSISLIGEDKNTTIINGNYNGDVIDISADFVYLKGFTIRKSGNDEYDNGIFVSSDYIIISDNKITDNYGNGITLCSSSNNNDIIGNTIDNNGWNGIFLQGSSDNILYGNIIKNNGCGLILKSSSNNNIISKNNIDNNGNGIYIDDSSYIVMRNNSIQHNTYNFDVFGNNINQFYHDIDTSNTINGKPMYYLLEQSMLLLDDTMNIGYLALVSCKNIRINNLMITNNRQGLLLVNTSYSKITNLSLFKNDHCGIILLFDSSNNIFNGNKIDNNGIGISLGYSSYNNTFECNNITKNFHGILLNSGLTNNNITRNTIIDNKISGIWLSYSSNNTIIGNTIKENNGYGIHLYGLSKNNIIKYNNITDNNGYGIYLYNSLNNLIYHNNFINNSQNAYDIDSNTWDNGYPSGGNFWDDYTGEDADGDGIGDTPYHIPGGDNMDRYPLGNFKPNPPDIDGPSIGSPGKSYCFTFHSINPNGDNIKYFIDWGDYTSEETPLVSSCEPIEHYHTWTEEGTFTIKAKATDIYGAESNWSYFEIEIPRNRTSSYIWYEWLWERFPLLEKLLNIIFFEN